MVSKKFAQVDRGLCVACGACEKECPRSAVAIHKGCYALVDGQSCIGCGKCAQVCPANAITIALREEAGR